MCIDNALKTATNLRRLADEIEKRHTLKDDGNDSISKSIDEMIQPDSNLQVLLTDVVNSLLGVVHIQEEPVDKTGDRPDLEGITRPQVVGVDFDAIIHSVYNIIDYDAVTDIDASIDEEDWD